MTAYNVFASILDQGLQTTHYFTGRSLLKSDFDRDQAATATRAQRLGEALGSGIADGLFVSLAPTASTSPTLRIQPGMAINRVGQTLVLPSQIDLDLANPASTTAASVSAVPVTFQACTPPSASTYLAGAGVYLVTIAPAYGTRDLAPAGGLPGMVAPCNTNVDVEGVMFRRIPIDLPFELLNDRDHLRNRVAYEVFGVNDLGDDTLAFATDPFAGARAPAGLIEKLRPSVLTDCEVPLALFHWTVTEGVTFVDQWSVRRRVAADSVLGSYGELLAEKRRIDAEARLLQFQEQLATVRAQNALAAEAQAIFRYLPPAGLLPVVSVGGLLGFDWRRFFIGMTTCEPIYIEAARAEELMRVSLEQPAIDVTSGVAVRLYGVREGAQRYQAITGQTAVPYFIFASGQLPFVGGAHFDVSRFDFANFSTPL